MSPVTVRGAGTGSVGPEAGSERADRGVGAAGSQPDPQDVAERQRAARALMLHPLLTADGPHGEDFRLVRRHQGELTKMFAEGLGYRLQVDPTSARLFKAGLGRDPSRPLLRRSGASFTPRAYAFVCLTLAALTRARGQLLVDELVQQVRSAAVDAGIEVDLDGVADRRALHAALLVLVHHGVLRERDGDLEHWVDQRTQSLLDVRRDLLGQLVSAPLSTVSSPGEVLEQAALPSAVGGARHATRRRLLESPLLTVEDLREEHAEWWRRNRNRERDWYDTRFGLHLELRAEGALLVDPHESFTDQAFPGADRTRQLALLVLERLADSAASGSQHDSAWRGIPGDTAVAAALEVHRTWAERLRRDQREDPEGAVQDAIDVLVRFGLVRRDGAQLLVHAAATRYAPQVTLAETSATGERSLFDDPDPEE